MMATVYVLMTLELVRVRRRMPDDLAVSPL